VSVQKQQSMIAIEGNIDRLVCAQLQLKNNHLKS